MAPGDAKGGNSFGVPRINPYLTPSLLCILIFLPGGSNVISVPPSVFAPGVPFVGDRTLMPTPFSLILDQA